MANSKISALTSAATVVGTEVLPIVQSSATVKVAISDLNPGLSTILASKGGTGQTSYAVGDILYASATTALSKLADVATGNALISGGVSTAPSWGKIGLTTHISGTLPTANGGTNLTSFTANGIVYASSTSALTTSSALVFDGANMGINVTPSAWNSSYRAIQLGSGGSVAAHTSTSLPWLVLNANYYIDNVGAGTSRYIQNGYAPRYLLRGDDGTHVFYTTASGTAGNAVTFTQAMTLSATSNLTLNVGNIVQGTAAKGFDFSANTPAAGKTSTILNWYEEGTWTPNQGAGLTLVGAFSSTGKYTRIGRNVTVSGTVTGATSVAVTAAGVITTNLPFTIGTAGHGNATNAAITASAAIICNTGTTVTSAAAIAATGTITFSATYFV
jgi:hypothetical protein